VIKNDGTRYQATVKQLYTFEALGRAGGRRAPTRATSSPSSASRTPTSATCSPADRPDHAMDPIHVEEPTMSVVFEASTSPLVGQEGDIVGGRQIKERLLREAESNISMRITETEDKTGMEVAGRGVLHLSVLMETMRREGYEFQVGRPQVILKKEDGKTLEPIELAVVDVPSEYAGKVIEIFGSAGGEMTDMVQRDEHVHLEFKIPSRGVMGLRTRILNARAARRRSSTTSPSTDRTGRYRRPQNGSLIAMSTDKAVAYALDALQQRGKLFVAGRHVLRGHDRG
jgi:GTP-binding protein